MKCAKISLIGGNHYFQPMNKLEVLYDELREGEVGDQWIIELVEMPLEEYDALPEFAGH